MDRDTKYITDEQWTTISPLLPEEPHPFQPANRLFVEGVLSMLITGTGWMDWPLDLGTREEAQQRLGTWLMDSTWMRIERELPFRSKAAQALHQLTVSYLEHPDREPSIEEDPILVELASNYWRNKKRAQELLASLPTMSEEEQQAALRTLLEELANTDLSKYQVAYPEQYLRQINRLKGNGELPNPS